MSKRDAERIAENILKSLTVLDDLVPSMPQGGLSASIGIAYFRGDAVTPEALLHAADLAQYQAKQGGRARFAVAGQLVEA